ncbi:MAG: RNA polymerase sigma factor [Vicinamibacterales bacterium]
MTDSDDELLRAAANGDRDAFAALYRRRRPDVYRFALHMTGSAAAAEDVAQDVFMTVIQDARKFVPGRASVVAWLLGIARNHARRRLSERTLSPLEEAGDARAAGDDPGVLLSNARELEWLRSALRALPVVYREAIVLCDLQELSYEDAAVAAGCAIGTVRSRLHRGRTLLAASIRGGRRAFARPQAVGWI